jgi:hypothetical protein
MSTKAEINRGHWVWKAGLASLVVLPFTPEVLILAVSAYAGLVGCQIDSHFACAVGPPSASEIIRIALQTAYFIGNQFANGYVVVVWLMLCFVLTILGWTRLSSHLLLGLVVSLIFAVLPYFGPMLSIGHLENPDCRPNEGIVGRCKIYGGNVDGAAHNVVHLGWRFLDGAPFALGTFVIFVIVVSGMHYLVKRPADQPTK